MQWSYLYINLDEDEMKFKEECTVHFKKLKIKIQSKSTAKGDFFSEIEASIYH